MDTGELLTRWSVRGALILYFVALALRRVAAGRERWQRKARSLWTLGFLIFVGHIACAFEFYHHWSHAEAYVETARRTAEVVHWAWGGGLYANYLFALVWGLDAVLWWRGLAKYERRARWLKGLIQGFLAFMVFNATVVFGTGAIRWWAAGAAMIFVLLWWKTRDGTGADS